MNGLVEKPGIENAPTNIAILGRYIITPKIFKILENTKAGVGGEIQLTDGLRELCNTDVYKRQVLTWALPVYWFILKVRV